MIPKRTKEHEWLHRLVGEWAIEGTSVMAPGQPPAEFEGTESVRSIGDLWIVAEGQGEMPDGSPVTMITTLGYDPSRGRFIGTFIGSMMTHLWIYDGALDAAEKALSLDTEGPTCPGEGEKMAKFRDTIELLSDDHRTLTSEMLGDDGEWHEFMKANYYRKE